MRTACLLVLCLTANHAHADKPAPPRPYKIDVPGGKFVFVMHSAIYPEEKLGYPQSGLYPADAKKPLWVVDWYQYENEVAVASDGVHLVRWRSWPSVKRTEALDKKVLAREALAFLANGKLIKSYSFGDLIKRPDDLPRSVSHFKWLEKTRFDDANRRFELTTLEGTRFLFDVTTGAMAK